ncbi:hypothetical protein ACFQZX_13960 [Mucilaginibacter litoreus]|uniref:Outer membrane protein beta-barrel family protein n=1 Tax=Mucilaginibacter litoreus TaxID=1048221 RepID=A0ABW3AV27_9SPHI
MKKLLLLFLAVCWLLVPICSLGQQITYGSFLLSPDLQTALVIAGNGANFSALPGVAVAPATKATAGMPLKDSTVKIPSQYAQIFTGTVLRAGDGPALILSSLGKPNGWKSIPSGSDTVKKNTDGFGDREGKKFTNKLGEAKERVSKKASGELNNLTSHFKGKIPTLRSAPIGLDLALKESVRYNPVSALTGGTAGQKFANVINVRGTASVFGVPLAIDYSSQPRLIAGAFADNPIFKFDLDTKSLSGMLESELDEYRQINKMAFGGMNVGDYAHSRLAAQINQRQQVMKGKTVNRLLTDYLDRPGKLNELLSLSQEQIRLRILDEATRRAELNPVRSKMNIKTLANGLSAASMDSLQALTFKKASYQGLAGNDSLRAFFTDPNKLPEIRLMNEDQIAKRLYQLKGSTVQSFSAGSRFTHYNTLVNAPKVDLDALIHHLYAQQTRCDSDAVKDAARAIMLAAKQDNLVDYGKIMTVQTSVVNHEMTGILKMAYLPLAEENAGPARRIELSKSERANLAGEADSIATSITAMKASLKESGVDVSRLLAVQTLLDKQQTGEGMAEYARDLYVKRPSGTGQSLMSHLSALKLGSFSNQPSPLVQHKDVFMQGAHVILNTGRYPVTAGYGTVNDINALKDDSFNGSVYNQSRRLTYLGAEIRNPVSGSLKFTVISSLGGGMGYRNYGFTGISADNVALTVSKEVKMGSYGNLNMDVSKSTTLFSSNYQIGTDAVLMRKGGLKYDAATDLFSALSFGASHHLELNKQDISEDVYVSYSGTGYQNPGVNGPGGARTKFGANLKKSFLNNRLQIGLRSDFNNQPISYTSDDRWKTRQVQVDGRYVFSRKLAVSLKYAGNNTNKQIDGLSSSVYAFNKFQLGANANYKIGRYFSVSRLMVSGQSLSNYAALVSGTRLFMMNYTQSLVVDKNVLTANVFYNKELATARLIGDMLNSDLSCQYNLSRRFSLSSGLTYLNNANSARQAGIRQNVNYRPAERFSVSAFIDIRKNLIRSLYPDLYAACRAELSLQYRINY